VEFGDTEMLGNQEHSSNPETNKLRPPRAWLPVKSTDVCKQLKIHLQIYNTCDQACKNRACGHMEFDNFFKLSCLLTFYDDKLWS